MHQNFDKVPSGCELGLIWFNYTGLFPAIGLASDLEPEDEPQDLREQIRRMKEATQVFNRLVDWQSLSACIDTFSKK